MSKIIEELFIEDEDLHQVFAVGLVDNPAIKVDWMKFSADTKYQFAVDKAKRIVTGPIAIPDLQIFRSEPQPDGRWVYFSAETIERLAQNFLKFGHQNTTTHNHAFNMAGNTVVESWIIEDSENDKANKLGYKLPKGTWMISVKIADEGYWNEMIETKKLTGFSLEGNFENKAVEMSSKSTSIYNVKEDIQMKSDKPKKRKINLKLRMKKLLEFLKKFNFNQEVAEELQTETVELASVELSFVEGERSVDIDEMFIATYADDDSLLGEGEHLVSNPDKTADYVLEIGMEGKLLALVTPWGLQAEGSEEQIATEQTVTETAPDATQQTAEVEAMKSEIVQLRSQIEQFSNAKNVSQVVKNAKDKYIKDDEKPSLAGMVTNILNNKNKK